MGELHGFEAGRRSSGIQIFQFADDIMVMVDGTFKEASLVQDLLYLFEAFSGLKFNTNKSVLFLSQQGKTLGRIWDYRNGVFPDYYLGMPLGAKSSISVWEPLDGHFKRRLEETSGLEAHWCYLSQHSLFTNIHEIFVPYGGNP